MMNFLRAFWTNKRSGFLLASLLVFIYVSWRAYRVGFTHDESLSFTLIQGDLTQCWTANNHWGNTLLMWISASIFGNAEWALRLPNVLSFLVFSYSIYLIHKNFLTSTWSLWIAFPILLLNPFILDFFSLARGYGLGLSFFSMAFYFGLKFCFASNFRNDLLKLFLFSLLCIYSNYAFMLPSACLLIATFIFRLNFIFQHWKRLLFPTLSFMLLIIPALWNILYLSELGELYAGGTNNMYRDTIQSIFDFSYYNDWYDFTLLAFISWTILLIFGFISFSNTKLNFLKIVLCLLVILPTILFAMMEMGFAKDRAAQYWMVMLGYFSLFFSDQLLQSDTKWNAKILLLIPGFISFISFIQFGLLVNDSHTQIWKNNAEIKQALEIIEEKIDPNSNYRMGINWLFEPTINYYIETKNYRWLEKVNRDGYEGKFDFYLLLKTDSIPHPSVKKIQYFPISQSILYQSTLPQ